MNETNPEEFKALRVRLTPEINKMLTEKLKVLKTKCPSLKLAKTQLALHYIDIFLERFENNKKFREQALRDIAKL